MESKSKSLRARLWLGFGAVMILMALAGITSWYYTTKFLGDFKSLYENNLQAAVNLSEAQNALWQLRYGFPQFMVMGPEDRQKIVADEAKWYKEVDDAIATYKAGDREKEEVQALKEFTEVFAKYKETRPRWFDLQGAGKIEEAAEWRAKTTTPFGAGSVKTLNQLIELQRKVVSDKFHNVIELSKSSMKLLFIILLIPIILAAGACVFLARSITLPLEKVIRGLTDGVEQVVSASNQVTSASQSLAEASSNQAASVEETSSSIEEMTSMTKQNADNAAQANTLMSETGNVVETSNLAMKELIQSMSEISGTSEQTAKIIKTIDEIAFQTNLLALNAAVEAARAGEAGAGFAVVANEVRNLAIRAADAAKNTSDLIEESIKKIKNGSEVVVRTNESFGKVAVGAKKVAVLVGEIAVASEEQTHGIGQINKAVAEMDRVVQQNSANAEESASAAEEMNAQAEEMKTFVNELAKLVRKRNGNGLVSVKEELGQLSRKKGLLLSQFIRKQRSPQKAAGGERSAEKEPKETIPFDKGQEKNEKVLKDF